MQSVQGKVEVGSWAEQLRHVASLPRCLIPRPLPRTGRRLPGSLRVMYPSNISASVVFCVCSQPADRAPRSLKRSVFLPGSLFLENTPENTERILRSVGRVALCRCSSVTALAEINYAFYNARGIFKPRPWACRTRSVGAVNAADEPSNGN
ncbi:unnamed protein product [Ectocarpus sp. 12 AP-2014]